jgi:hypothetical protein
MNDLEIVLGVLFAHWISDFVFQNDSVAKEKSSCNFMLAAHVVIYSASMLVLTCFMISGASYKRLFAWAIINGILHFGVDFITSRISSSLYKEGRIHEFFICVGIDQFIHYACLLVTLRIAL